MKSTHLAVGFRQLALVVLLLAGSGTQPVLSQVIDNNPEELRIIDVIEHLGDEIPLQLPFVNSYGDSVTLAGYFNAEKPVMLIFVYYNCPMLCTMVLNGVVNGMQPIDWLPGKEFQIVTISIDPRETPKLASDKKHRYVQSYGRDFDPSGWAFLTGDSVTVKKLAEAIGFSYYYDEKQDIFAHPAVVTLLTPEGVISRYLYGVEFKPNDLRLGLLEASRGKIGTTMERILLYCYQYDPDAKGYVVFARNVMKLGGMITLSLVVLLLAALWIKEKIRK